MPEASMQAAIRRAYGPPEQIRIESLPRPIPETGDILVRVRATTVNRTDVANLRAKPYIMRLFLGFFKPRRPVIGTDFAGEIVEVGAEVTDYQPGDRVFGFQDTGLSSQAEYLTIAAASGHLARIPEDISCREAVAGLEGGHYAYSFLMRADIQSGQKVLINGASGAIGSALLQFVRQKGVETTVTCREKDAAKMQTLGADRVIDYTREDFTRLNEQYDFVFDAVGKSRFGASKRILKSKGVYTSSELGSRAENLFFALTTPLTGGRRVIFPVPFPVKQTLPFLVDKLASGEFHPLIDREYTPDQIVEAYQYAASGKKTGNVLLVFDD